MSKRKGRIAIAADQLATREQAEAVLGEHARLSAQLETIQAELAERIVALNTEFEGRIEILQEQIKGKTKLLNTWADANEDEFGKKKSIEFIHGRIGYRTSPPSVRAIKGKLEDLVASILIVQPQWIRTIEEIDKEKILAEHREGTATADYLKAYGLKVVKPETFFVEPKLQLEPATA